MGYQYLQVTVGVNAKTVQFRMGIPAILGNGLVEGNIYRKPTIKTMASGWDLPNKTTPIFFRTPTNFIQKSPVFDWDSPTFFLNQASGIPSI